MDIGIAFDLKPNEPHPVGAPDDLYEEFDAPVTIKAIGDANIKSPATSANPRIGNAPWMIPGPARTSVRAQQAPTAAY